MQSQHVRVTIDLGQIVRNVKSIRARCGVPVIAVVKADAYGLGVERVSKAIAPHVDAFYTFDLDEALPLHNLGKPTLTLRVPENTSARELMAANIRPVVTDLQAARRWRDADPILSIDTGQQRFACPADRVGEILHANICREAMTHATTPAQVERFLDLTRGCDLKRHAAGSALLDDARARLDAVRPGLAMYVGAVRVSTTLIDVRDATGPIGYTGFTVPRFGVILCGYAHGLRPGPCLINGQRRQILEVGMQSAFVEAGPSDRVNDEVTLLDQNLPASDVARDWQTTPQEALLRLVSTGRREYCE